MPKSSRRRKGAGPRPVSAWRERRALAELVTQEFDVTRPEAVDLIREVEASSAPARLGCVSCDDCHTLIVAEFDPADPDQVESARQAVRLHVLFCPGRAV